MKQTPHKTHDSQEPDQPIRLCGTLLGARRHICAFFKSHDDHYGVLLPFIQDGFSSGEKAVHIVNPTRRDEHVQRLNAAGIDVAAGQKNGQLELLEWADVHLQGGTFDADRTRKLIAGIRRRARDQGFRRVRFVTHMEWAVERHVGVDGLLEYEASANLVPSEDPVVCAYELANFGGDVVVDIMRTHPMVIIGGMGSIPGAIGGAVVVDAIKNAAATVSGLSLTILGGMIVLVVLFFPGGLKALLRRHAAKRLRLEGSRNATVPLDA